VLQALQFEIAISRRCVNTMSTSTATKDMLQVATGSGRACHCLPVVVAQR